MKPTSLAIDVRLPPLVLLWHELRTRAYSSGIGLSSSTPSSPSCMQR